MRRLALVLSLLARLMLAPAAHAAQPGVNIVATGAVADAAATGAKTIRLFAVHNNFPTAYPSFVSALQTAHVDGMNVIFVLVGNHDGEATDPAQFASFAGQFASTMAAAGGAAGYEVW